MNNQYEEYCSLLKHNSVSSRNMVEKRIGPTTKREGKDSGSSILSICTTGQTDRQTGEQTRGALYH
jgi:hypothetical protein